MYGTHELHSYGLEHGATIGHNFVHAHVTNKLVELTSGNLMSLPAGYVSRHGRPLRLLKALPECSGPKQL
jgi:hypothetical protein